MCNATEYRDRMDARIAAMPKPFWEAVDAALNYEYFPCADNDRVAVKGDAAQEADYDEIHKPST
jgi:hypothetical protein